MLKKQRIVAILLICAFALTGCFGGKDEKNSQVINDPTVVFTFAGENITKGEVYIYANSVKERYELCYGMEVWDKTAIELATTTDAADLDEPTIEELTRENIITDIVDVKILLTKADDYGIVLTNSQTEELRNKADDFYNGLNDDDKKTLEITGELAYKVLYENTIAGKVRDELLKDNSLEISDEEARMTTFYDMYFECFSEDANGNITPYTDEQKKQKYEDAIQACGMLATADVDDNETAKSIDKLAAYYELPYAREYTLRPDEILDIYGQDICDKLYSMQNGDYSVVIESEYGYHVFQMIALTDQKATSTYKDVLKKQRMNSLLADKFESWRKKLDKNFSYPESINMDVYNSIKLSN